MSKTYNRRKNIKEKQSREKIIIKNKLEYLESFKKEYDNERIKKQSLETRAGIIITMLGGLFIFLINDLELFKYLFIFFKNPSCLINYLKFLLILAIIIYFILIFYQLINILKTENTTKRVPVSRMIIVGESYNPVASSKKIDKK